MPVRMAALNHTGTGETISRKAIPRDVRAEYKRLYGVSWEAILKITAGTSKHQAKALHGQWIAEIETRIERIRAAAHHLSQPLTKLNALALAGRWYSWFVARHEGDPGPPEHWEDRKEHLTERVWYPHAPVEHLEDPNADSSWPWTRWPEVREAVRPEVAEMALVASFLATDGLALTQDAHILFVDAVSERLFSAYALLEQRARGDYSRDNYPDTFPAYVDQRRGVSSGMSCWALFGSYVDATKPAAGTINRWRAVFQHLQAAFPLESADALTEADARAWSGELVTAKRSAGVVSTVWAAAANRVFSWGVKQKHIRANPFAGIQIDIPKVPVLRETKAFKPEEVQIILQATMRYAHPTSAFKRAQRWAMWLCAYSGARAGEITQLRGTDIIKRGELYAMRLTPEAGTIKTGKARTVPLHEHITAQGFIEFARAQGAGPLFYNARPQITGTVDRLKPGRHPSVKARERLGTWVRALGIDDPEVGPTHGWRHTFKQVAEREGITEKVSDAITGHAASTTGRSYGAPTVEDMAEALKKFPRYMV
jgi:integrase